MVNPDRSVPRLHAVVAALGELLGYDSVLTGSDCGRYAKNCLGSTRQIIAAARPRNEAQVVDTIGVAQRHAVPVYPVSTGNNWGYGSATPVADGCLILDLSMMNRVVAVDDALATVTVQPGVTTGQLATHLSSLESNLMVPVTGAGPDGSLIGNALERGYGITPETDHFAAVLALRAVLPDGTIYQGALADLGGPGVNSIFKWGLGPYLDGLFTQGNFGVVTQMTIGLRPRPDDIEIVLFEAPSEANLTHAVLAVRDLLQDYPGTISAFNLMNRARIGAMEAPAVKAVAQSPAWVGIGALYGGRHLSAGLRRAIRSRLGRRAHVRFFRRRTVSRLRALSQTLPERLRGNGRVARLNMLADAADMFAGYPRPTALPLAYLHNPKGVPQTGPLNPASDGCGLIWYAPLVPMDPAAVDEFVQMVSATMDDHDFAAMITLTTLSCRVFDSSVPIVFNRERNHHRAHDCYQQLLENGRQIGCLPYRLNIEAMDGFAAGLGPAHHTILRALKNAIDPTNCIAPGRYAAAD